MPPEPRELAEARALLAEFEAEMHKPEGIAHLSEALALLADIRDGGDSAQTARVASNIALAYAGKIHRIIVDLNREQIVHSETILHWQSVLEEFEKAEFVLLSEIVAARNTLSLKKMSPSERQSLLQKLQEIGSKSPNPES